MEKFQIETTLNWIAGSLKGELTEEHEGWRKTERWMVRNAKMKGDRREIKG